jgi:hypothetical protein
LDNGRRPAEIARRRKEDARLHTTAHRRGHVQPQSNSSPCAPQSTTGVAS